MGPLDSPLKSRMSHRYFACARTGLRLSHPLIARHLGAPSGSCPVFQEQCSAIYWAKLSDVCIHQHRSSVVQRGSSLLTHKRLCALSQHECCTGGLCSSPQYVQRNNLTEVQCRKCFTPRSERRSSRHHTCNLSLMRVTN
jgi:hypothetical protein